ncbi:MAG: site-specific DNA-methyltransferase [Porcipelethomonas sp.]
MEKMKMHSADITKSNIDKIAEWFPNCITETADENGNLKKAINFETLHQMLSEDVAEGDEAYEFTWVGKKAAIVEANKPIRKTLRPCKEESVDWDTTENLYIEGDNLKVLKLLQESYLGKVKMIYIDPPYNTGSDRFIYTDDFHITKEEYKEMAGYYDEEKHLLFRENTESNPQFHSVWCSMIYSRLMLARNLLSDDGVIFISIDDNEVDNLRKICDEIFGAMNFIAMSTIIVKTEGRRYGGFAKTHEQALIYSKNIENTVLNEVEVEGKNFSLKMNLAVLIYKI